MWVLWAALAAAGAAQTETLDRILAVVAGQVIMQSDVRAYQALGLVGDDTARSDEAVLDYLIARRLVLDEVDRYLPSTPPAELIDARLQEVASRFSSAQEFEAALARLGFTLEDLRRILRDDARRDAYIENRFGTRDGVAGRDARVAEWIARLVQRGQVVRPRTDRPPSG